MRSFSNYRLATSSNIRTIVRVAIFSFTLSSHVVRAESDTPHCKYASLATLPIQLIGNQVIVHGSINGKSTDMVLDTGTQTTTLTRRGVENLGLPMFHSDITSIGVGGESKTYETVVDEMAMDRFKTTHRSHFLVAINSAVPFNVIVGTDMLFNVDFEMNLADHYVKLLQPSNCDHSALAYWDKSATVVPISEISSHDKRQIVTVEINGQKMRALIDSGAHHSILNLPAAARLGITSESTGVKKIGASGGVGTHKVETWVGHFNSFAIGDEIIKNPTIMMMDLWGAAQADNNGFSIGDLANGYPDMVLGADFLRTHRVLLALSQNRLYFTPNDGAVFLNGSDERHH